MSILILIYILNCAFILQSVMLTTHSFCRHGPEQCSVNILVNSYATSESLGSAARLRGFEEDLGMEGTQFATVLSVLYIGYIAMQIPSCVDCRDHTKP